MKARKIVTPSPQELQRLFDLPSEPSPHGELLLKPESPASTPETQTVSTRDIDHARIAYFDHAVEGLNVLYERAEDERGLLHLRAVVMQIESWIRISEMSQEEIFEATDDIIGNMQAEN
jgi:hypothetical protein